jgi:hypothetical protein
MVWLYPKDFNRRFGSELVQVVEHSARDPRRGSPEGMAVFWTQTLIGLFAGAVTEHLTRVTRVTISELVRAAGLVATVVGSVFLASMQTRFHGSMRPAVPAAARRGGTDRR